MTLKARLPVLVGCTQYRAGDELPAHNAGLVQAWLENGVAYWDGVEPKKAAPKAVPAAAEPGLGGKSSDGDPEALVGKIPKKPNRQRPRGR